MILILLLIIGLFFHVTKPTDGSFRRYVQDKLEGYFDQKVDIFFKQLFFKIIFGLVTSELRNYIFFKYTYLIHTKEYFHYVSIFESWYIEYQYSGSFNLVQALATLKID